VVGAEDPQPALKFGRAYVAADEEAASGARNPFEVDPDLVDRGVRGHATTQNALAEWVTAKQFVPRSPSTQEPKYDLGWIDRSTLFVSESRA
jgi:hypothetical protein